MFTLSHLSECMMIFTVLVSDTVDESCSSVSPFLPGSEINTRQAPNAATFFNVACKFQESPDTLTGEQATERQR